MKKYSIYSFLLFTILFILIVYLNKIGEDISEQGEKEFLLHRPSFPIREDIEIYKLETGFAQTVEGFMLAGGSLLTPAKAMHNAIFIRHPKGNLLIDTGIGKDIDEQYKGMPLWSVPLFAYSKGMSARDTLQSKGISIDRILLTHMHWDHASGVEDFPNAEVWTTKEEHHFALSDKAKAPSFLKSQYDSDIQWNYFSFTSGPYEIFKESHDIFGDKSIIIVKLKGHSPGSVGIFVNFSPSKRYFFTGDLTWTVKALRHPAHKFILSSMIVDYDRDAEAKEINRISTFLEQHPEIIPVPSHDAEGYKAIELLN